MQCPIDGTTLEMTDRAGVEIDYCPQCRGVWLDRGELDKIIERTASEPQNPESGTRRLSDDDHRHTGAYRKKKRGGFLEDLFDF